MVRKASFIEQVIHWNLLLGSWTRRGKCCGKKMGHRTLHINTSKVYGRYRRISNTYIRKLCKCSWYTYTYMKMKNDEMRIEMHFFSHFRTPLNRKKNERNKRLACITFFFFTSHHAHPIVCDDDDKIW